MMSKTRVKKTSFISMLLLFAMSLCLAPAAFAWGAKPYPNEVSGIISHLRAGEFDKAMELSDSFVKHTVESSSARQNKHLVLLERGRVALAAGKYDQSIADLQEAERRFLTIEGTFSLTEGFGSILTDDTAQEYEAEMHEKLMISPYLVLAYLNKGDFEGARVERNRTIAKINQYIEEKPEERAYLENGFARYLTAVMYEMDNKIDDAKIEYRKMNREREVARLDGRKDKTTDLVIFVDVGLAPHKYEVKWGPMPVPIGNNDAISLGFSYAAYAPTHSEAAGCSVSLDGNQVGNADLLYDLEKTILAQYEKNKSDLIAKLVARMTAKAAVQIAAQKAADQLNEKNNPLGTLIKVFANIAGALWVAVEHADLRAWMTLPKQVHYIRLNDLAPGEHVIKIDFGFGTETRKIKLEKDKINVEYFTYAK